MTRGPKRSSRLGWTVLVGVVLASIGLSGVTFETLPTVADELDRVISDEGDDDSPREPDVIPMPRSDSSLSFGPVEGFTTESHPASEPLVLPLFSRVPFSVSGISVHQSVRWDGMQPRSASGAQAVFDFNRPGVVTVAATILPDNRQLKCDINVVRLSPKSLPFTFEVKSHRSPSLMEEADNELTVSTYFDKESIAQVVENKEGDLITSVGRSLSLSAHPRSGANRRGLASLLEWRVDGQPIGVGEISVFSTGPAPGIHRITIGPPAYEKAFNLIMYSIRISSQHGAGDIPVGQPVTFVAVSDPPGYESIVTWLAATKFGSAEPTLGDGPTFTTTFKDTVGPHVSGNSTWEWIGVRADNARLGQDQKLPDLDGDLIPDILDNCPSRFNPLQVDLDVDGLGDVCDNCPTEVNPGQEDANFDGGGDVCEPSPIIGLFGDPFIPQPGVAPELLDQGLPHPLLGGTVHPVIQFNRALMEGDREELAVFKLALHEALAHNVFLASVPQGALQSLAALPFVRSLFPIPLNYRIGSPAEPAADLDDGQWQIVIPLNAPLDRSKSAMAYDSSRQLTVLFGGDSDGGPAVFSLEDTWEWNGDDWVQRTPARFPPARSDHAMAFDEERSVTVLFGGLALDLDTGEDVESNETWIWDGTDWTFELPANSPLARSGHALAFERALGGGVSQPGRIILFGGRDQFGNLLNDTWSWDGTTWTELNPATSPQPRFEQAMAYDPAQGEIVLFGGSGESGLLFDDTWAWDGVDWSRRDSDHRPSARAFHSMAAQNNAGGVLLFGGQDAMSIPIGETWFWNGENWSLVQSPAQPQPRSDHSIAYDTARRQLVLFGGHIGQGVLSDETWILQPSPKMDVMFHADVSLSVAEQILLDHDALILQPGVDIVSRQRVNIWLVAIPESAVTGLSAEEPVIRAEFVGRDEDSNDGSRVAIGVDAAQAPPSCGGIGCTGNGIVFAQWETRWAPGDTTLPAWAPALPAGTHAALTTRVTVRDLNPLNPADPAAPAGCAGSILCQRCLFSNHATHVAGTMLGDGTNNPIMIGMAPAATNVSYNLPTSAAEIACELNDSNTNFNARLANNSWGLRGSQADIASYDARSTVYDQQIVAQPAEAVFFAAGNQQRRRIVNGWAMPNIYTPAACTAVPIGVTPPPAIALPPANVSNRFLTLDQGRGNSAKNTIVIGAINSGGPGTPGVFGEMTTFSSWGPTQDGRIKPDLVTAGSENNTRDCSGCVCGQPGAPAAPACDPDPMITSTICTAVAGGNCNNVAPICAPGNLNAGVGCTINSNCDLAVLGDGLGICVQPYGANRGTSMATPAATGGAGLLLEEQLTIALVPGDTLLDSDSLKALLIHTATDLPVHFPLGGNFMGLQDCDADTVNDDCWPIPLVAPGTVQDGPDYVNGWGLINIPAAIEKIQSRNPQIILQPSGCPTSRTYTNLPFNSPLEVGGDPASIGITDCSTTAIWDWVGYIDVPSDATQLRVTIAWDDQQSPAPATGSTVALVVNDLDLIVTPYTAVGGSPAGDHNYSWWLDPACPHLQAVPVAVNTWSPATYADHRNNVEQVIVGAPASGTWRIVVQSIGLAAPQPFSIMISIPPSTP